MEPVYHPWQSRIDREGRRVHHKSSGDYRCLIVEEPGGWCAQLMGPPYCYPHYGMETARFRDLEAARRWADAQFGARRRSRLPPPPSSWLN